MVLNDGLIKYRGLIVFKDALEEAIMTHYKSTNTNYGVLHKLHKDLISTEKEISELELLLEIR